MIVKIGILAIQGGFLEHINAFKRCSEGYAKKDVKIELLELRNTNDLLDDIDGVVLPGGESTTMGRILGQNEFGKKLEQFVKAEDNPRKPAIWGTCSGLIILANSLENQKTGGQYHIGGLDITVSRNYFGRQLNSFEAPVKILDSEFIESQSQGIFIRAPAVLSVDSGKVKVLGTIENQKDAEKDSVIVAVKQNNILATAFHPELTDDLLWHNYFIELILKNKAGEL